MNEIIVRPIALPYKVNGFVSQDENGDYNIYINALQSYEMQQETYQHEMSHIALGHFGSQASVKDIEREARSLHKKL